MTPWPFSWTLVATVLLSGAVAAALLTWIYTIGAQRLGVLDHPDGRRKLHRKPVVQAGGLAMALSCHGVFAWSLGWMSPGSADFSAAYTLVLGGSLAVALGLFDDLLDLRPVLKLAGQLLIGLFFWDQGVRIERITGVEGLPLEAPVLMSAGLTALWFALLMNGINMIDGLDGLAAGVGGISALTLAALAGSLGQPTACLAALVLAATCGGFLLFNRPPASVFMGDAGSHLLGCHLAAISLMSSTKTPAALTLALPLLAVALPLFETGFAFVRRLASGYHPFRGDRRHLHHRMLDLGFSARRILATFCYLTATCGIVALVSMDLAPHKTMLLSMGVLGGLAILTWNLGALEKATQQKSGVEVESGRLVDQDPPI